MQDQKLFKEIYYGNSLYFVGIIITDILNKIFFEDKVLVVFNFDRCVEYDKCDEEHRNSLRKYSMLLSIFWPIYLFLITSKKIAIVILRTMMYISDLTVEKIKEKVSKDE